MDSLQATKNLISDAMGYIDLVLDGELNTEQRQYLTNCRILLVRAAE